MYRVKKKALAPARVDYEESYMQIQDYAKMILEKMPQTFAIVKVKRNTPSYAEIVFDKFIVAFLVVRDYFNIEYRLFIGIDGCHLKGPLKKVLLLAVELDGNTRIYLIAVCICD